MIKNHLKSNIKILLTVLILIISTLVIFGWVFNSIFILEYFADNFGMKLNTALFFFIISLLYLDETTLLIPLTLKRIIISVIVLSSIYTVFQHLIDLPIDIDNLFIKDIYNKKYPGRMSVGTAISFILLSVGVLFKKANQTEYLKYAQNIFATVILIATVSLITHTLNIPAENKSLFLDTMSINTSILFLTLGIISIFEHKYIGILSIFFSNLEGSKLLKTIFPIIFFLPIGLSYLLILAESESIVKNDFGIVLHTVVLIIITFLSIAFVSRNLNKTDVKRKKLEDLLKTSNKKLLRLNKQLQEKNIELEQFVYIASHDLQEPLRTVTSISEMLEDEYKNTIDDNGKIYIKYIREGIQRMHNLVRDLMDYSRLGTTLEFKEVNLNTILDNIKADLKIKIKESKAEIENQKLPVIKANEGAMRQLFQNLLANAIKFRTHNTIPKISITAQELEEEWTFSVIDNGIGIDKKNYTKIFKIFKRLHKEEEYSGTGIGLANCKKIVELHNGKIWITPNLTKGSTFNFTLKK